MANIKKATASRMARGCFAPIFAKDRCLPKQVMPLIIMKRIENEMECTVKLKCITLCINFIYAWNVWLTVMPHQTTL
jgi:hypothetical protein